MKKNGCCDRCFPNGEAGAVLDAERSNGVPVWTCRCCGSQTERRVYKTKKRAQRQQRTKSVIDKLKCQS